MYACADACAHVCMHAYLGVNDSVFCVLILMFIEDCVKGLLFGMCTIFCIFAFSTQPYMHTPDAYASVPLPRACARHLFVSALCLCVLVRMRCCGLVRVHMYVETYEPTVTEEHSISLAGNRMKLHDIIKMYIHTCATGSFEGVKRPSDCFSSLDSDC
jgi:hypothetical protein